MPTPVSCYYRGRARRPAGGCDTGSQAPRRARHWRFVCDHCRGPGHLTTRFHCPRSGCLPCREAGRVEAVHGDYPP